MVDPFRGMEKTREFPSKYFREEKKAFPKKPSLNVAPALPVPFDNADCIINTPALELGSLGMLCLGGQTAPLP